MSELRFGGRCQRHPLSILPCEKCAKGMPPDNTTNAFTLSEGTTMTNNTQTNEQPDGDLLERCREILAWQKTGALTGDALRNYAKAKYPSDQDHRALQNAENDTARESYAALLEADAQRPAMKPLNEQL